MENVVKTQLVYWLPVYVWAALIFYLSSISAVSLVSIGCNALIAVSDYYKHVLVYGFLTFLLWRALRNSSHARYAVILAVMISVVYGLFNEVHQYFIPWRHFSVYDLFFDFVGSVLVLPLLIFYDRYKSKRRGCIA